MDGDRGLSLLADVDQWARCHHAGTALLPDGGVQLTWLDGDGPAGSATPDGPAGLACDLWGRVHRSRPAEGRLSVHSLDGPPPAPAASGADAVDLPSGSALQVGALSCPRGVAVDRRQRLCIAEAGGGYLSVVDLWADRLLTRLPFRTRRHPRRRPVDVVTHGNGVAVLLQQPAGIALVTGRTRASHEPALRRPRYAGPLEPTRIATSPGGGLIVLWCRPQGPADDIRAAVVADLDGTVLLMVDGATDLVAQPGGVLVVATTPGRDFRRLRQVDGRWIELEPIVATDYVGGAIATSPDGGVIFTTATGFGWTGGSRVAHVTKGQVISYRLDSGQYRTRWGRVFLDACVPTGTDVRVRFLSTDGDEVRDPMPPSAPARGAQEVRHPELTPPLPTREFLDAAGDPAPLHRRATGRERPWAQIPAGDRFETYEAPVTAPAGRYLWIQLVLTGTPRATPTVRAMRVERPGHRLLGQLPRSWSRDDADADFARRFLEPMDGLLHELDQRAAQRDVLLRPSVAPQEALGWLASFAGLVLDRRWPEHARRALIAEAYPLFRRRGTLATLERLLELYLGVRPAVVEDWRTRGLGGALIGVDRDKLAVAILGQTIRAGGATSPAPAPGGPVTADAFRTTAHRFTVLVPMDLTTQQRQAVQAILDLHRPAHTVVEVCELGFGMRVGRHARVGLTSHVGSDSGWGPSIVGYAELGGDAVVGVPTNAARVGADTTVGAVRVG